MLQNELPESKFLGKIVSTPISYEPSLLVAVPRILNREQYGISNDKLPFVGVDVWHTYEFSFLTNNGLPVAGTLKIVYSCTSEFLVESKSLKLYLNSLNMSRWGKTRNEGLEIVLELIKNDLKQLLKCQVDVSFFGSEQNVKFDFADFQLLEEIIDEENLTFEQYNEDISLLKATENDGEVQLASHLLRSNCKITGQPDWGTVFISMKAKQLPDLAGLLKYIVSLRNENHFHEEITEMIFKRLLTIFSPDKLTVSCLYTRRGGIDICPTRSLNKAELPENLTNYLVLDRPAFRQ